MRRIDYIILHHSATPPRLNTSDKTGEKIAQAICERSRIRWEKEFPLYKCDYHFLIGPEGDIFKGQTIELPAWHATNYKINLSSIGICFLGNFQTGTMRKAQFESGVNLVKKLIFEYKIPVKNVLRHKDVISDITGHANSTLCPGKNFPFISMLAAVNSPLFSDVTPSYRYYKEVAFLKKHGIIKGENGEFKPKALATREEVALIAYRILSKLFN